MKANVFLAVSSLPTESAEEYHTRQVLLQARWDMLEAELKTRMAELGFEKEQKVRERVAKDLKGVVV